MIKILQGKIVFNYSIMQIFNRYIIPPFDRMVFIKSNNWYYKPHSLASGGVGGSCVRSIINKKKRRT